MNEAELEREREMLREAFVAGWQAALAVRVNNPAVLAVITSCFDQWLQEESDEVEVFGLAFRRRQDLPLPVWHAAPPYAARATS